MRRRGRPKGARTRPAPEAAEVSSAIVATGARFASFGLRKVVAACRVAGIEARARKQADTKSSDDPAGGLPGRRGTLRQGRPRRSSHASHGEQEPA
jgi:hypothetical protein